MLRKHIAIDSAQINFLCNRLNVDYNDNSDRQIMTDGGAKRKGVKIQIIAPFKNLIIILSIKYP